MDWLFWVFAALVVGFFAWRYFRHGSLTGALLGGHIVEDIGEIELDSPALASRRLKVHMLQTHPEAPREVALAIVSKAALGASMVPIRLSKAQALQLAALLERAGR